MVYQRKSLYSAGFFLFLRVFILNTLIFQLLHGIMSLSRWDIEALEAVICVAWWMYRMVVSISALIVFVLCLSMALLLSACFDDEPQLCMKCGGTGRVRDEYGYFAYVTCPRCNGAGYLHVDDCSRLMYAVVSYAWRYTLLFDILPSLMHCLASSSNICPLNADFFFSTWQHPRFLVPSLFEIFCILFISRMIFVPFIFPFSQWRLCWFCLVLIGSECSNHYLILDCITSIRIYNITMHLRLLFCRTKFTYELINLSNFPDAPAFSQIQPKLTFSASIIKRQSDHK